MFYYTVIKFEIGNGKKHMRSEIPCKICVGVQKFMAS